MNNENQPQAQPHTINATNTAPRAQQQQQQMSDIVTTFIPKLSYSFQSPLLIHTSMNTHLCLQKFDYYQKLTHFKYDPQKQQVVKLGDFNCQPGMFQTQIISTKKDQAIVVILCSELKYNGEYIDSLCCWNLITDTKHVIRHQNSDDQQSKLIQNLHVFKKSKIICVSECHLDHNNFQFKKLVLKYYQVDQIINKISKPLYISCCTDITCNKQTNVYNLNQQGMLGVINLSTSANSQQIKFSVFNFVDKNLSHKQVSVNLANFIQKQTNDPNSVHKIEHRKIDDIWEIQKQMLYVKLSHPKNQAIEQYIWDLKQNTLCKPSYKIDKPRYDIQYCSNLHIPLNQRRTLNPFTPKQYSSILTLSNPLYIAYNINNQQVLQGPIQFQSKYWQSCIPKYIFSYNTHQITKYCLIKNRGVIINTVKVPDFPWNIQDISVHFISTIIGDQVQEDLLMQVDSLLTVQGRNKKKNIQEQFQQAQGQAKTFAQRLILLKKLKQGNGGY